MTKPCPLCQSLMHGTFKPSDHPAIPDRTVYTCTRCELTLQDEDFADFDASLYAGQVQREAVTA